MSPIPRGLTKPASRACPVCAARQVEPLHHEEFILPEGSILPPAYDVVACPQCGFAYADTPLGQDGYDQYYAEFSKYADQRTATGGGGSRADSDRLEETAEAIARVIPDRAARILDIGCANGGLLGALRRIGYVRLLGIDPSRSCVAQAAAGHGVEVRVGTLTQLPQDLGSFDVILLSHVLEHVVDLRATLDRVRPLLAEPGGLLYVEVPDASRYTEHLVSPFQDFNVEHINHFSPETLRRLLAQAGFQLRSGDRKVIRAEEGWTYPAVFGFFGTRGGDNASAAGPEGPTDEVREALLRYITRSREIWSGVEESLAAVAATGSSILVWGTGQLTLKLLAHSRLRDVRITAFIDGNPVNQGKRLIDLPVLPPEEIRRWPELPILVSTLLHGQAVIRRIRDELQLPNPVFTLTRLNPMAALPT